MDELAISNSIYQLSRLLAHIPIREDDLEKIDYLQNCNENNAEKQAFFYLANEQGVEITSGLWAFYLLLIVAKWGNEWSDNEAISAPVYREIYPGNSDLGVAEILDAASEVFEALGWATVAPSHKMVAPDNLMTRFHRLAVAAARVGYVEDAYDIAALALDLGPKQGSEREVVVRFALTLASEAEREHQIVVCTIELNILIIEAADFDITRRLEAFNCCEIAIEWLSQAPEASRNAMVSMLLEAVRSREYLRVLAIPIVSFLPPQMWPPFLGELLDNKNWPQRISTAPFTEWANSTMWWHVHSWDTEIEKARLELEPQLERNDAFADWTTLTVEHPAYRRAVPHHRSFLREIEFDRHLLVLTHEITHVYTMLGGIGIALASLHVATIDAELALWGNEFAHNPEFDNLIKEEVVAPLEDNHVLSLFRAEQSLELTLKAHILQDVWTPWFEGLAIFGEIAADPAQDPTQISVINECLRNLINFEPPASSDGSLQDDASIIAAFEKFASEFEARCSVAVAQRGPARLRAYFRSTEVPYFAGYLAVRSVVSAWRQTLGRPLSGAEAFGLLLHATRYGTAWAVPDLSMNSELFAAAVLKSMSEWVFQLAALSRLELENFLAPQNSDAPTRLFYWQGSHPVQGNANTIPDNHLEIWVLQALKSLTRAEDTDRLPEGSDDLRFLIGYLGQSLKDSWDSHPERLIKYNEMADQFIMLKSLLPIGHTDAKFNLHITDSDQSGHLMTQIRTAEACVPSGEPSINGIMFPLDSTDTQKIAKAYHRLRKPRLRITRLLDLTGVLVPGQRPGQTQVIAFQYDDWLGLVGSDSACQRRIQNEKILPRALELVSHRLSTDPFLKAVRDTIPRGKLGATRTKDWINRSPTWLWSKYMVDANLWAVEVCCKAERVLSEQERPFRQKLAAKSLLTILFNSPELSEELVEKNFDTLTEQAPHLRQPLISMLFQTAQMPGWGLDQSSDYEVIAREVLPIFSTGTSGYDVLPAQGGCNRTL